MVLFVIVMRLSGVLEWQFVQNTIRIMKFILSAAVVALSSFALVCCGSKDVEAAAVPVSHSEIADGVVNTMYDMISQMAATKDVASAEAFAATIPDVKAKMKNYLEAAQSLPAPTDDEKVAFEDKMNEAQEKAGPALMAMMMAMPQNPDAEAIGKIIDEVMDDQEMKKVVETLEAIYKVEASVEDEVEDKVEGSVEAPGTE